MLRVGLVGCVKEKRKARSRAKDLYISSLFRKARDYVEKNYDDWLILSAKYGLIDPEEEIEPYDETLSNKPVTQRRQWAQSVFRRLQILYSNPDSQVFMFHAGEKYREFLEPLLRTSGYSFEVPMKGLPLGKQLQWYESSQSRKTRLP